MPDLNGIFGENGLFAREAPGFVHRPDQLRMALAVASLLADDLLEDQPEDAPSPCSCLVIEAETGLGKTLAYLAPAVLHNGRVVVSTNTRNLQDQILDREIPLIRRHLMPDLRVVCVKGRQNYLCLHRWHQLEAESEGALFEQSRTEFEDIKKIAEWLGSTRRGDRTELSWLSGNAPLWQRICCLNHFCLGQDCADHAACFLNQLRREAAAADILVVNHHLLFSDLALRSTGFGEVLPRYESVIFDEAHHLENVATTFFGRSFSRLQTQDLAADMERTAEAEAGNRTRAKVVALARGLEQAADDFARAFPSARGRFPLDWNAPEMTKAADAADATAETLFAAAEDLQDLAQSGKSGKSGWTGDGGGKGGPWQQFAERAADLAERLRFILAPGDVSERAEEEAPDATPASSSSPADAFTFWYERTERNLAVSATPVEVAGELQRTLYATARHCLFTSATLTTGGNFTYFFSRMGLPEDTPSLTLASPFDYANRTLIYLPERGFPAPAEAGYQEALHQRLEELVRVSGGRALLLFTSRQAMEAAHRALAKRLPYPVFMQGEAPRHTLLNRFSRNIKSVLFAVASFWEGVDVPGESLSLVVMDKLPFEVPSDPVVQARMRRIEEQGGKPFFAFQVPRAIFTLRQGAGRLMRSREDRGVIAILDIRLMTKGYGRDFIRSLPPAPLTHDLARVAAFFSADKPDKQQQAATDQP